MPSAAKVARAFIFVITKIAKISTGKIGRRRELNCLRVQRLGTLQIAMPPPFLLICLTIFERGMGIMMKTVVEKITPEKAREYLKTNTNNYRKMSRATIKRYADIMKAGKWELNGEPICFSESGVLKDGQHRLAAIVMSGVSIETNVTRGVSESVTTYNTGKRRTDVDIAHARGIECDSTLIAAARIIVNKFSANPDNTMTLEYTEKHIDELNRAMRIACYGTWRKTKNAPSIAASYIMLRTGIMPSYEVELFFRLMNDFAYTHADGYEVSPPLIAQQMFDERGSKHSGYQIQKERLEILIMAMKDFHKGNKRVLKYKIQEPFQFMELLNKIRKEDGLEG